MSVDLNQTIADASLDNLHDIIMPEAVGFFPLAPGWMVLFLLAVTLLFHLSWQSYLRYQKVQYRRDALAELETLKEESKAHTLQLLSLAKRVGMAAYGREAIAKLEGDVWWDFMQTHAKVKVEKGLREALERFLYAEKVLDATMYEKLLSLLTRWVKTHV